MCNNNENEEKNTADYGLCEIDTDGGKFYCLTIIGQIEGHQILPADTKTTKYEHVLPLLVKLERDKNVSGILLVINTMGGDVEAGLAIAEMISGMSKPSVSLVIGGGHSIGIPLAVCTDYSFITGSATMTVHPVRTNGLVINSPQTFRMLEKMQERITGFVTEHSKITEKSFEKLLMNTGMMATDVGTILTGEEAVREGLIDSVGGIHEALEKLEELKKTLDIKR